MYARDDRLRVIRFFTHRDNTLARLVRHALRLLPLLLCLLAIGFWIYGYRRKVVLYHHSLADGTPATLVLGSDGGRIHASYYRNLLLSESPSEGWSVVTSETWGWPSLWRFQFRRPNYGSGAARREINALGFAYWDMHAGPSAYYTVLVPYWFVVLLLAIGPALQLRALIRRRRNAGMILCPSCGYDLRASPERCPECGHAEPGRATA